VTPNDGSNARGGERPEYAQKPGGKKRLGGKRQHQFHKGGGHERASRAVQRTKTVLVKGMEELGERHRSQIAQGYVTKRKG